MMYQEKFHIIILKSYFLFLNENSSCDPLSEALLSEMVLMKSQEIFIQKIVPKLSLLPLFIWPTDQGKYILVHLIGGDFFNTAGS